MSDEQIAKELLETPGQTLVLQAARTPEALARDGADRTFSKEAVEELGVRAKQWILSRLYRKWFDQGIAAQEIEVEVTVKINGEPLDPLTLPARLHIFDGQNRGKASRGDN